MSGPLTSTSPTRCCPTSRPRAGSAARAAAPSCRSVTPLPWLASRRHRLAGRPVRDRRDRLSRASRRRPVELYQLAVAYRAEHRSASSSTPRSAVERRRARVAGRLRRRCRIRGVPVDPGRAAGRPARSAGRPGTSTFRPTQAGELTADLEPQVFGGQQSNTSVMFGDVAMLKLFRRLELGRNLDIEVHDALEPGRGRATWPSCTAGSRAAGPPTAETQPLAADLAMVVEKLADAQDGWELALEHHRRVGRTFADDARRARRGAGRDPPGAAGGLPDRHLGR